MEQMFLELFRTQLYNSLHMKNSRRYCNRTFIDYVLEGLCTLNIGQ